MRPVLQVKRLKEYPVYILDSTADLDFGEAQVSVEQTRHGLHTHLIGLIQKQIVILARLTTARSAISRVENLCEFWRIGVRLLMASFSTILVGDSNQLRY